VDVTRKGLKRDKFALEVQHGLEYVSGHRRMMIRYGSIGAAVVVLALGFYFYQRHQSTLRQQAVETAMRIENATIGPAQTEYAIAYPTDGERNTAARKAWSDVASRFGGSNEGVVAEYFLGAHAADDGKVQEAQKRFQAVIDSGKTEYVALAKLAMGAVLAGGVALAAAEPAAAGVSVGIGIGIPGGYYGGHPGRWCYWHPGYCRGYGGVYAPGVYWAGHGYWYGNRWWGHRYWYGRGWRYR